MSWTWEFVVAGCQVCVSSPGYSIVIVHIWYAYIYVQTSLSNTAIDNPMARTKQTLVNSIIEFLDTDTVWWAFVRLL